MKSVMTFIRKHPKTALAVLIIITALIVYHRYFFGGYVFLFEDIGSDTRQQYVAWYNSIAFHLNQGDLSFWDASYGFGTPLFSLNLFHPTLGILYLVGALFGGGYIAGALIYVHLIHLVIAGLGCYLFLASFRLSKRSVLLCSYLYAFNGYLVMWGQHYHFAIFVFYLPLILALIERSLAVFAKDSAFCGSEAAVQRRRALILMPVCTGVLLLSGYYLSYMIALICLVYLILRFAFLKIRPVKTMLKAFFGRCLLLLLGVGIGLVYILPSYATVAESSARLDGGSLTSRILSSFSLWPKEYYLTFCKKLCSTGLEGIGISVEEYTGYGNIYEAPNIFLTGLFLILFVQFLIFFPKIAKTARARIVLILGLLFALVICFVPAASLVFNGFAYPFSRHLFILIPFMALLCAFMLDFLIRNRCFSVIGALITILFTAFFCLRAIPPLFDIFLKINAASIFILTFLMAFVLLLYLKRGKLKTASFWILIMILCALQIISNTYTTVHRRTFVSADSSYFTDVYGENDRELDAWLAENETGYYRLEKTFYTGSETMDSMLQDYRGISGYNATMNKYVIDFTDNIAPEFRTGTNPYWLTFRNLTGRDTLLTLFGIKYIVSDEQAVLPASYQKAAVCGDTTLYEDPDVTFAHFFTETITEEAFTEASRFEDGDTILADYLILNEEEDCSVTSADAALPDLDSGLYDRDVSIRIPESGNDGVIDIELDTPEDGYVFIPVSYENGWQASVDGEEADLIRADYGFMAVKTPEGTHTVSLHYTAPYLILSAAGSLVSLIIYLLFLFLFRRAERKKKLNTRL